MTDFQNQKKLFAKFDTPRGDVIVQVSGLQEAIDIGLDQDAKSFQTYKADSALKAVHTFNVLAILAEWSRVAMEWEPGKKEAWERDKRENLSGMYYIGMDKIQTAAEIAEIYEVARQRNERHIEEGQSALDGLPGSFHTVGRNFTDEEGFRDYTERHLGEARTYHARHERARDTFRQYPPETPCLLIHVIGRRDEVAVKLEANDKVYDSQGRQIWGKTSAPAATARPTAPRP
jgi:hypothetical protein